MKTNGQTMRTGGTPRWLWPAVVLMVVLLAGAVLFRFNPSRYPIYPLCVFHELTGLNCPGCGATRALYQLGHGHVLTALRDNALLILSLPVAAYFFASCIRRWLRGEPLRIVEIRPWWVAVVVGGLVAFMILRNIPVAPFVYLSPP